MYNSDLMDNIANALPSEWYDRLLKYVDQQRGARQEDESQEEGEDDQVRDDHVSSKTMYENLIKFLRMKENEMTSKIEIELSIKRNKDEKSKPASLPAKPTPPAKSKSYAALPVEENQPPSVSTGPLPQPATDRKKPRKEKIKGGQSPDFV